MKEYEIIPGIHEPHRVRIVNKDENPIIDTIECLSFPADKAWSIIVEFKPGTETSEMRNRFQNVPTASQDCLPDYERLATQYFDMDNIILFFQIIQSIDAIPFEALAEVEKLIDFPIITDTLTPNHKDLFDNAYKTEQVQPGSCLLGSMPTEVGEIILEYAKNANRLHFFNRLSNQQQEATSLCAEQSTSNHGL